MVVGIIVIVGVAREPSSTEGEATMRSETGLHLQVKRQLTGMAAVAKDVGILASRTRSLPRRSGSIIAAPGVEVQVIGVELQTESLPLPLQRRGASLPRETRHRRGTIAAAHVILAIIAVVVVALGSTQNDASGKETLLEGEAPSLRTLDDETWAEGCRLAERERASQGVAQTGVVVLIKLIEAEF